MSDEPELQTYTAPSPLPPGAAELASWNALSRDEQVRRYRESLAHPDCDSYTAESPDEILAAARAKVAARERG